MYNSSEGKNSYISKDNVIVLCKRKDSFTDGTWKYTDIWVQGLGN